MPRLATCRRCGALRTVGKPCSCAPAQSSGPKDPRWSYKYRQERAALLASKPPCYWCGAPATQADHVPPLHTFADPSKWVGQLVPACQPCNGSGAQQRPRSRVERSRVPVLSSGVQVRGLV